jgi:molybdate transport system ATP-binding protein
VANVILSMSDATIRTTGQQLFAGINLEIRQGEHWAITGANEVLQAALLEALAGKANIIKGKLAYPFFDAYRAHNPDPLLSPQKCMQLVSFRHPFRNLSNTTDFYYQQRFNSIDSENALTVAEYLDALHSINQTPVWTFEKVVRDLKLLPLLDEKLIMLSNGETKRILLAAALLRNPVLLLLQSPLAGLDVAARTEITTLLNKIAESGITLILVTTPHEIPDAITHVAVCNSDGAIKTFPRPDFSADAVRVPAIKPVDESDVKDLLAQRPVLQFHDIIQMKNVSIRYGDHQILDNINWTVKQGERWALSGPNGSGKSTLLSLINGDNPQAFANHIVLFDRRKGSGESIWDIKRKIGFFAPELYQYFPLDTSCLQAVESGFWDTIGLFRPSHSQYVHLALRWMKLLHVDHLSAKLLRNVTPVQQRLCLLARALVKCPPLLLLDEPCQGFDAAELAHFKQLIEAICAHSNTTLIYVSHYAEELPHCITKHLQLQAGRQVVITHGMRV